MTRIAVPEFLQLLNRTELVGDLSGFSGLNIPHMGLSTPVIKAGLHELAAAQPIDDPNEAEGSAGATYTRVANLRYVLQPRPMRRVETGPYVRTFAGTASDGNQRAVSAFGVFQNRLGVMRINPGLATQPGALIFFSVMTEVEALRNFGVDSGLPYPQDQLVDKIIAELRQGPFDTTATYASTWDDKNAIAMRIRNSDRLAVWASQQTDYPERLEIDGIDSDNRLPTTYVIGVIGMLSPETGLTTTLGASLKKFVRALQSEEPGGNWGCVQRWWVRKVLQDLCTLAPRGRTPAPLLLKQAGDIFV